MIVGFTGTQGGMTERQYNTFLDALFEMDDVSAIEAFHHGDCIGADKQSHTAIRRHYPDADIHIHPPTDPKKQAHCEGDYMYPPKPYLDRNQDIVDASEFVIGTPGEMTEQLRSGTWATIRRTRKAHKGLVIVYPDGSKEVE